MKTKILIAVTCIALHMNSQNMKDFVVNDAFDIKILKISPEAITYINSIKGKEKLTVAIGADCSQKDFESVCKLDWIESLQIGNSYPNRTSVLDIKPIESLKKLKRLAIFSKVNPTANKPLDASIISKLTLLERLTIVGNNLTNTKKLSALVNLEKLSLSTSGLNEIGFLSLATKLTSLSLTGTNTFTNVSFFSNFKSLEKLEIENNKIITEQNLKPLEALNSLVEVSFIACTNVKSLNFLINNIKMEEVYADESGILTISGLSNMVDLTKLSIPKTKVTSLDALKEKRKLTTLEIAGLTIADLSPLYNCVSLEKVYASPTITEQQQKELQAKLPNAEISIKEEE